MVLRTADVKIFLPTEPDEFLKIFLSHADVRRVAREDDFDFVVYPKLVRDVRTRYRCDLDAYGCPNIRRHGKPLIVFSQNDYEAVIECEGLPTVVYRTGLSRGWRLSNEFTLPYVWITHPDTFVERPRAAAPVIGFCGTLKNRGTRRRTLAYFGQRREFACNYLIREKFWAAGLPVAQAKAEYEHNIDSSDFVICDCGIGNWTVRMYEVLSRGRIPALLDTGAVLPEIRSGRWDDTLVTARTRRALADRILHVWRSDDIVDRQRRCRALWADNFSMTGFAGNLSSNLERIVGDPAYRDRVFGNGTANRTKYAARRALYR